MQHDRCRDHYVIGERLTRRVTIVRKSLGLSAEFDRREDRAVAVSMSFLFLEPYCPIVFLRGLRLCFRRHRNS